MDDVIKVEKPVPPRHQVRIDENSLTIVIPAKKRWFILITRTLWVIMSTGIGMFGILIALYITFEIFLPQRQAAEGWPFFGVFLIAWFCLSILNIRNALESLLWEIAGIEFIKINQQYLMITHQIWNWRKVRNFDLTQTHNFLVSNKSNEWPNSPALRDFYKAIQERISFDYGAKAQYFGRVLDDAEARQIIAVINEYISGLER